MFLKIPIYLLSHAEIKRETSKAFCEMVLSFLIENMDKLSVPKSNEAKTLLRLFEIVFASISIFPDNESVMQKHMSALVTSIMESPLHIKDPSNSLAVLRLLFRAISGRKFELLYKEFVPFLPPLLIRLNEMQRNALVEKHRITCVELCLTVPVRLLALWSCLHLLVPSIITALNSNSIELIGQGLRMMELCVDNLAPEFFHNVISSVRPMLLMALYRHLKPYTATYAHGPRALRILGKMAGRNRHQLLYKEYGRPVQEEELDLAKFLKLDDPSRVLDIDGQLDGLRMMLCFEGGQKKGTSPSQQQGATDDHQPLKIGDVLALNKQILLSVSGKMEAKLAAFGVVEVLLRSFMDKSVSEKDYSVSPALCYESSESEKEEELPPIVCEDVVTVASLLKMVNPAQAGGLSSLKELMYCSIISLGLTVDGEKVAKRMLTGLVDHLVLLMGGNFCGELVMEMDLTYVRPTPEVYLILFADALVSALTTETVLLKSQEAVLVFLEEVLTTMSAFFGGFEALPCQFFLCHLLVFLGHRSRFGGWHFKCGAALGLKKVFDLVPLPLLRPHMVFVLQSLFFVLEKVSIMLSFDTPSLVDSLLVKLVIEGVFESQLSSPSSSSSSSTSSSTSSTSPASSTPSSSTSTSSSSSSSSSPSSSPSSSSSEPPSSPEAKSKSEEGLSEEKQKLLKKNSEVVRLVLRELVSTSEQVRKTSKNVLKEISVATGVELAEIVRLNKGYILAHLLCAEELPPPIFAEEGAPNPEALGKRPSKPKYFILFYF